MRDAKWPEAIDMLEALRREVTNMPGLETQINLLLAVCANKLADQVAEEKAFQRVLNADPKNVQARVGLCNLYLQLGRFDDAVRELEAATQSPYAAGVVIAQYVRSKTHKLRLSGGSAEDWRRVGDGRERLGVALRAGLVRAGAPAGRDRRRAREAR